MACDLTIERGAAGSFWLKHRGAKRWEDQLPSIREAHRERVRVILGALEARFPALRDGASSAPTVASDAVPGMPK